VLLGIFLSVSPAAQQPATDGGQSSGSAAPAPQEASDTGPQRFRTEANYVRVDAYPTRNGEPVQDLRMEEFEILEDGKPQVVRAFEHVVISPAGPQSLRVEAGSVQGGEQMAANPRNRVFVFFLDVAHVPVEGSHHIKEPLIRLMDRVLGPDDLVAVMTPEMSAAQITFGRKTDVIAEMLRENWTWGRRHSIMPVDQREIEYERCYPYLAQRGVVAQMVARRRERVVLDALHDLVRYLGGVREERKAIVTVSNGWVLYRPNASLTDLRTVGPGTTEPVPGLDPIGVDEHGKLRVGAERRREGDPVSQTVCDRERMHLAAIDNDQYFRYLIDLANRHNASFYTVDPRGLAVFDYPIGPVPPPPIALDMASLRTRLETLQTLAEGTDGMAVVNSNDLDKGLRRIADDLTSYYLLGYYSTNTRLDGGFRKITVRVKRPGVQVRARRGYRAATAEEVSASRAAAAAPVPAGTATASSALAMLGRIRPGQRFSVNAVPVRSPDGGSITAIWVAGEIEPAAARELRTGGTAVIELSGGTTARASATLAAGARTFLVRVPVSDVQGAVDVLARVTADAGTADRLSDSTRIEAITSPAPLLFRRGLSTGNRIEPAADFRFSRTERLRLELAIPAGATPGAGRFLDRNAQTLQLPVQVADRVDADGQRWLTADATLSPLGAGDYVIEIVYTADGAERRILTAVRVTR
jgi:VWFA-related protein